MPIKEALTDFSTATQQIAWQEQLSNLLKKVTYDARDSERLRRILQIEVIDHLLEAESKGKLILALKQLQEQALSESRDDGATGMESLWSVVTSGITGPNPAVDLSTRKKLDAFGRVLVGVLRVAVKGADFL